MDIQFKHHDKTYKGRFRMYRYANNGNIAIELQNWDEDMHGWDRYAMISINTDTYMDSNHFVAKMYSENLGLVQQFIDAGLFTPTGELVASGYVEAPVLGCEPRFLEMAIED